MFNDFRRLAVVPIVIAAVVGAIIAAAVSYFTGLPDPVRNMLLASAGAIGGMVGSALMQASVRADERRRLLGVLRVRLKELAAVLESDVRMLSDPMADDEGQLHPNAHLLTYAMRARETCKEIASLAEPQPQFDEALNTNLVALRTAASGYANVMASAEGAARTHPLTVEQFLIACGTAVKYIDVESCGPVTLIRKIIDHK